MAQEENSYFPSLKEIPYNSLMWDVHEFVRSRVNELGLELNALSESIGRNHSYAQQFVSRRTPRRLDEATREIWAKMLKVPPEMLKPDYTPEQSLEFRSEPTIIPGDAVEAFVPPPQNADDQGYFREHYTPKRPGGIPEIDVRAGAGEGMIGDIVSFEVNGGAYSSHRVIDEWGIPAAELAGRLHISSKSTVVGRVIGDSMEPAFRSNDPVFVDTSVNSYIADGLYLISDGFGPPKIKRLQYVSKTKPPRVRIISDNPIYPINEVDMPDVTIHGRVAVAFQPK